jgi:cyclic lactone autoinducer peptide
MKSLIKKITVANILKSFAMCMVVLAANILCVYIFHQPEQPSIVKKYRRF